MTVRDIEEMNLAGEFIVKPGTVLGPRELDEHELVLFPDPTSTVYEINGTAHPLNAPCLVLTRPNESHTYRFDSARSTRHLFVHFGTASGHAESNDFALQLQTLPPVVSLSDKAFVLALFRHLLWLLYDEGANYEIRAKQILATILTEMTGLSEQTHPEQTHPLPQKVLQALRYIEGNLNRPITVPEVAAAVGWSPEHLSRHFAATVGWPPQKVIRKLRIARASELLVQSERKVGDIAHEVGIDDENYFSRMFKEEKNMTASEFRNRYSDPRFHSVVTQDTYLTPYPANQYLTLRTLDDGLRHPIPRPRIK